MKKTLLIILAFAVLLAALYGVSLGVQKLQPEKEASPAEVEATKKVWNTVLDMAGATRIKLEGDSVIVHGEGVSVTGTTATIVFPGTYDVTGMLNDGQIVIDSANDGTVFLVLNGADITCSYGPAVYVKNAGALDLYLPAGTQSSLTDAAEYAPVYLVDGVTVDPEQPNAVLFSKDDITVEGEGSLAVKALNDCGVRSKDKLTVCGGTISVSSVGDGIKATDGVTVSGGTLDLLCADDGVCSNKGYVLMTGGTVNVSCYGDGLSAYTDLTVSGGDLTVANSGEALEAPQVSVLEGRLTLNAQDKAISASTGDLESGVKPSDCSVTIAGGAVFAAAPVPVKSDGDFDMKDGALFLTSRASDERVIKAKNISVKGGLLLASGWFSENPLPDTIGVNSVFLKLTAQAEAGTAITLQSAEEGSEPFLSFAPDTAYDAVCVAYEGLSSRDSYVIASGETVSSAFTPQTVLTTAVLPRVSSNRGGGSGGPRPF